MSQLKSKKRIILQIVFFLLVILGIRWYINLDGIKPIVVRRVEIQERVVEKTVSATGAVRSNKQALLSFNTIGRISQILVDKGDTVTEGQFLANLDATSLVESVQYYKDARDIALRERDLFVENYETKQEAYGGMDEYEIKLRQLDEMVSQAEANLRSRAYTVNDTYIYAPFSGIIVEKAKESGETAMSGETIIALADLDDVVFEINLDQEDYGLVKEGMQVEIDLDAYPNTIFNGIILDLPYYADGSGNFTLKISINSSSDSIPLIGMTGDAHIVIDQTESAVPSLVYDEIFTDQEDKTFLWVEDNGYIKKEYIEIGLEGDIYTEIKSRPDKNVVIPLSDTQDIKEGYKAKLTN